MNFQAPIEITKDWPDFEEFIDGTTKSLAVQNFEDQTRYEIFALDGQILYRTTIWKSGSEPAGWGAGQISDNDAWRSEFETTYLSGSNNKVWTEITPTEKRTLELDLGFDLARQKHYSKLIYNGDALTSIEVYEDDTEMVLIYQKDFEYTDSALTKSMVTRLADGAAIAKDITYDGDAVGAIGFSGYVVT